MLKAIVRTIVVFAALIVATGTAYADITCAKLDNGARVVIQEDHSTHLVAVDVWIRTGSINETDENNGVSHFIEHLLFKGTETRGPGQVDMEIETLGGTLDARTSRDWTHFFTTVDSKYLDKSLDVLSDILMHPKFNSDDIEHERKIILDEIARSQSGPFDALEDMVFAAAFTSHPYKMPIEGTPQSVSSITKDTITNYYSSYYVPANATVVLVGDISATDGIASVKKAFAGFSAKSVPNRTIAAEPTRSSPVRKEVKRNTRLSYVAVAFPSPTVNDQPDTYAMDVLMAYLGTGYQSWISTELRGNKKLIINSSSDCLAQLNPGLAVIMASAEPSDIAKVQSAILDEVGSLRASKLSDFDLDRAKRAVLGGYASDVETFAGIAANLGFYSTVSKVELAPDYVKNIRKVTSDDVQAAAKKYFDPNEAVIVATGP